MLVVQRLLWDEWNAVHIARHDVTPQEVEEVCHSGYLALAAHTGRILLIGLTTAGRVLAVVLDPQAEGAAYVVTARSASKKERQYYRQQKGGAAE
ncbi:MAG: hypothetical protein NVS2B7_19570 [Herpetosiphon sp.]